MDEVNDFFDFSKPFKRVVVSSGYLNGRVSSSSTDNAINKIVKREHVGQEYAQSYADAEKLQILKNFEGAASSSSVCQRPITSYMDTLEDLEDDNDIKSDIPKPDYALYEKYQFEPKVDCDLPIFESRTEILKAIRENRCVVLEGDTGCGKTTQVPQYIIEDSFQRQEYCNIICTQPRRIAAISIAKRVCSEKNCTIGSIVGYQVGLHTNSSEDTRLLYCTTGVLLQKLIKLKKMSQYTHIILDEVHERDQDMDFLLIVIRRFLTTNSPHTKVILMSATINTTEFSDYFKIIQGGALVSAPIIKVDTRRLYTVKPFYLCELAKLKSNLNVNYDEPGISDEMYKIALKLLIIFERLDAADEESKENSYKPSILIFLPGIYEIDHMANNLDKFKELDEINMDVIPIRLHSMISPDEQQKVFMRPPPNYRKIILATNIAESSITVPDVKYVIDFCLTKSQVTDTSTNLTSLQLHWASKANCKQRAGRAGRVMNGRVYRLVSRNYYENYMDEFGTPEMMRCPLENVILKAKLLDIGPPQAILGLAMTPPNLSDIRNTILVLKETGALLKTVSGKYETFDGDLTFIGRVMAALPIDIRLTRLIIFGYIFSILEETIIIAAGLNVKSIFEYPSKSSLPAYSQKLLWSDGSGSDLFAILKAYRFWVAMKEQNNFEDDERESYWARRYYINTRSMKEMYILVNELKSRLLHVGIKESTGFERINWLENEQSIILKIVISGAFYPNYFLRPAQNNVERERNAFNILCGHDPCNTVYFTNFDNKLIGQLYIESIKNIFQNAMLKIPTKNIEIKFEYGTQKVFVTFKNDSTEYNNPHNMILWVPGRVRPEIYKALKLRQLRLSTAFFVMNSQDAIAYAEEQGLGLMIDGKWEPVRKRIKHPELVVIPSVFTKEVRGKITHIDHCGKFWFQPSSEIDSLKNITKQINNETTSRFNNPSDISKGMLVAVFFQEIYHRAKVLNVEEKSGPMVSFRVLFIDYGNCEIVEFSKLRAFKIQNLKDIPPRVFECSLAGIQPSSLNCPTGRWPNEAMELMQEFANQRKSNSFVHLEIYSVVNGLTSVIMKGNNQSVNELLVSHGYAQFSEENYMSKSDHDLRMRQQAVTNSNYDKSAIIEDYLRSMQPESEVVIDSLPIEKCKRKIELRGPFSPLEATVHAAIRIGTWKTVKIDHESVNSILLDADPQDSHERLLVSATITENANRGVLTARQTTVMPNIPGFGPLMGLIFCPTMELRRDKHKTKYVSILCGLGSDKNQSIFEEHDMVFNLDVDITPRDLETINQIRYSMDTLLATDPGDEIPKITPKIRMELTAKIKHLIIKLLEKQRKYIEIHHDTKDHIWNQIDRNDILESNNIYGSNAIFPLHTGMRLYNESFERMDTFRRHCQELHEYRKTNIPLQQPIKCQLCDQCLENTVQLRIHLLSQLHRDREYQIGYVTQL